MALTATQKAQIRLYLGYPDQFRYENTRLESILDGGLSAEAETLIGVYLTNLETVEAQILSGSGSPILNAGVKRVDEIWFFGNESGAGGNVGFRDLKDAGRYYANRISIITGVPIYSDAFGKGGYLGDSYASGFGQMFPLG